MKMFSGKKIGIVVLGHAAWLKLMVAIDSFFSYFRSKDSGILSVVAGSHKPNERRILCIFAHFDRDNMVDDYVLHYLCALDAAGMEVIFCTTAAAMPRPEIEKIRPYCRTVIIRRNVGYDFGSYRAGLEAAGELTQYDAVVLANDSAYGPLSDLRDVFDTMAKKKLDFWGITESYEFTYHIQSYFLVFGNCVFSNDFFLNFWRNFPNYRRKQTIIARGELGLSKALIGNGYTAGAFCADEQAGNQNSSKTATQESRYILGKFIPKPQSNPTHHYWRSLIEARGCPFIKIELLRNNPASVPDLSEWEAVIQENSDYDPMLIRNHLERIRQAEDDLR